VRLCAEALLAISEPEFDFDMRIVRFSLFSDSNADRREEERGRHRASQLYEPLKDYLKEWTSALREGFSVLQESSAALLTIEVVDWI
jgi:hypothetical protein